VLVCGCYNPSDNGKQPIDEKKKQPMDCF